jgi:hypothetical protein
MTTCVQLREYGRLQPRPYRTANPPRRLIKFGNQKTDIEKQYRQVLIRYDDCHRRIAIFNAVPRANAEIPEDFDSAVSYYLHDYDKQSELTRQLDTTFGKLGVFADRYKSNNEAEAIRALEQELDALPKREEALQLRWNSHIHGLKSNFDAVLHDLRLVESAKDKLNRELAQRAQLQRMVFSHSRSPMKRRLL